MAGRLRNALGSGEMVWEAEKCSGKKRLPGLPESHFGAPARAGVTIWGKSHAARGASGDDDSDEDEDKIEDEGG